MGKKFSADVSNIKVEDIGNNFLRLKIYAISEGVNNNSSEFLLESFEPSIPSFYNKPILGFYNKFIDDLEEHNSSLTIGKDGEMFEDYQYEGGEKPIGVIPESAEITIEEFKKKKWITISNAIIWSDYSKQIADLIKKKMTKKVSVEVEFLDYYVENGIDKVKLFKFDGITILGDRYSTGIDHAHLTLQEIADTEKFINYRKALCFAMTETNKNSILSKYGINTNKKTKVKMSMTYNELRLELMSVLDDYKIDDDDGCSYYRYYIEDITIDDKKMIIFDEKEKKYYFLNFVLNEDNTVEIDFSSKIEAEHIWIEKFKKHEKRKVMSADNLYKTKKTSNKNLGLVKSEKEEKMKEFIKSALESGFSFIGLYEDKYRFVKTFELSDSDESKIEKQNKMVFFETEAVEGEFSDEVLNEVEVFTEDKFAKDKPEDGKDGEGKDDKGEGKEDGKKEKEGCGKESMTSEEIKQTEEYKILMAEKEDFEKKYTELQAELDSQKFESFKAEVETFLSDKEEFSNTEKDELIKMVTDKEIVDMKSFTKEYAYRKFVKDSESESKIKFNIDNNKNKKNQVVDALDKILNS